MNTRVVCVLAAASFVGVFRLHATGDAAPQRAPAPLSAARSSVLESDAGPAAVAVPAARLVRVAALGALHREPPAKVAARRATARRAAAARQARATARRAAAARQAGSVARGTVAALPAAASPTATPAARPVTAAPPAPASAAPYVGTNFDSAG